MSNNDRSADNESDKDGSNSGLMTILAICGTIGLWLFGYYSGESPVDRIEQVRSYESLMDVLGKDVKGEGMR